ncbi:MAG: 3'-5' exonuclease domain-containing protein 2 [Bacteroidales bacterium]|nr:3'-5' exonuclease domain-containing protein 2 [Bacteroidales bacterium]
MFSVSITQEEIEKLPLSAFDGEIHVISSEGPEFDEAVKYLRNQKVIGFDTETRPTFSPEQRRNGVALLQLSGSTKAFLFRVQKLGIPKKLSFILGSEKIIKVGAAVNDDVHGLQHHWNFKPNAFVDLQKIVWEYGIRDKSVKKMGAIILGIRISKTQQLSNWEADVLSEAQQRYAATDAWICREMYLKLNKSHKNPLAPDEMLPPDQLEAHKRAMARKAEAHEAQLRLQQEKELHRKERARKRNERRKQQRKRKREALKAQKAMEEQQAALLAAGTPTTGVPAPADNQ